MIDITWDTLFKHTNVPLSELVVYLWDSSIFGAEFEGLCDTLDFIGCTRFRSEVTRLARQSPLLRGNYTDVEAVRLAYQLGNLNSSYDTIMDIIFRFVTIPVTPENMPSIFWLRQWCCVYDSVNGTNTLENFKNLLSLYGDNHFYELRHDLDELVPYM